MATSHIHVSDCIKSCFFHNNDTNPVVFVTFMHLDHFCLIWVYLLE